MKNIYFNRLQKKRNKENNNSDQTTIPLKQYINNGNRLNSFSGLNKIGVNRSSNFKNENKSNNNLINSYNQSIIYLPNYKNRNDLRRNNHSLFDSNKQQIINIDENNNYIRFESYNIEKEKENKNVHLSRNNSIFNSSKNNNSKNIGKNYSYQKNYFNNNITNINYNINIQNFTVKKNNNNTSNDSNNNIYYSNNNNNKTNKYISHIKDDLSNKSNNFSNYKNNYNFTEINYTNKNKNKNETNIVVKNKRKEPMKRNLTENNHLKRKCKESEKDKDKEKYTRSSSIIKLQVYNLKQEKKEPINNKKVNNIREINNKLPIKLNIEDINKEKLSRLKRIIEQGSTNIKNYKMEISKNLMENNAKTPNKTYNKKKVNNTQYIFKKKKINVIKKEESKEGNININPQKIDNNYLTKSSIKNTNKRPLILNAQLQQTNYKIKSGLKTNNYFLRKEKNVKPEINKENKYQRIKYNEMMDNNNNNDDTISLSYSKEQNISFFSKKIVPNEKSLFLPFLIEQFFLYYNKLTKDLIITDKNKKNKEINNESDDDDYQLTKEIILLKRGLTAKSELSKKLVKKMRQMRMQRVCNMNLFGNKKIYKKKMSS